MGIDVSPLKKDDQLEFSESEKKITTLKDEIKAQIKSGSPPVRRSSIKKDHVFDLTKLKQSNQKSNGLLSSFLTNSLINVQRISEGSQEHSNDEEYDDLVWTKSVEKKMKHLTSKNHQS